MTQRVGYIKLMPDYASSHIWAKDGVMLDYSEAQLSEQLIAKITSWGQDWTDFADSNNTHMEDALLTEATLIKRGQSIAQEIASERKECKVIFTFDGNYYEEISSGEMDRAKSALKVLG